MTTYLDPMNLEEAMREIRDLRKQVAKNKPPKELLWLYTHCCAIGMNKKSDSGKLEHDIALFTADLCTLLEKAEEVIAHHIKKRQLDDDHELCVALAAIKQWKDQT